MPTPQRTERHIKCLEWAIALCRMNLDQCSGGDLLKLNEGLYEFIYWAEELEATEEDWGPLRGHIKIVTGKKGHWFPPMPRDSFAQLGKKDVLVELQKNFIKRFYAITSGSLSELWRGENINIRVIGGIGHSGSFQRVFFPAGSDWSKNLVSFAEYNLVEHLVESGISGDQIRTCPRCASLFLSRTKPRPDQNRYCSLGCSRNAATQAYRLRKKEELKEKEKSRNRTRYEKRIRAKFPNTPIKKFSRKKSGN